MSKAKWIILYFTNCRLIIGFSILKTRYIGVMAKSTGLNYWMVNPRPRTKLFPLLLFLFCLQAITEVYLLTTHVHATGSKVHDSWLYTRARLGHDSSYMRMWLQHQPRISHILFCMYERGESVNCMSKVKKKFKNLT